MNNNSMSVITGIKYTNGAYLAHQLSGTIRIKIKTAKIFGIKIFFSLSSFSLFQIITTIAIMDSNNNPLKKTPNPPILRSISGILYISCFETVKGIFILGNFMSDVDVMFAVCPNKL